MSSYRIYGGAQWGVNLVEYRKRVKEPWHPRVLVMWALLIASLTLFVFALLLIQAADLSRLWHLWAGLPFLLSMAFQHRQYTKSTHGVTDKWREIKLSKSSVGAE
jgi:hypothetical protein